MLTITRKDLLLTVNDNVIPAMGSSDVPVKFVNDTETYAGFLIEPRVGYYINGCPKSGICEYDTSSNIIKIPAEAFKNKGILVIAIALIDNADSNHIEVTKELALEVTPAPNGTVILPATDTWQTAVKNLVEQLYNQDYKPQFDEIEENLHNLVKEAQNQQNKANNQQTQIDNAIDVMGDYEIVQEDPTQIRFKKGDGTYGDTVNLGDNLASKSMVNAGYDTYSGNSYSGSASDYGIEIGKASGSYEQVTTNGYQLFDQSKLSDATSLGVTLKNNGDGSFTITGSGNITGLFSWRYDLTDEEFSKLCKDQTKVSLNNNGVSNPSFRLVVQKVSDNTVVASVSNGKTVDVSSFLSADYRFRFQFYGADGSTIVAGIVKPMLYCQGDGTWEPFTGGEPSPSPDYAQEPKFFEPKHVNTNGGNLFDASKFPTKTNGGATITNNGDGSLTISGSGNLTNNGTQVKIYTHEETVKLLKVGKLKLKKFDVDVFPRLEMGIYNGVSWVKKITGGLTDKELDITSSDLEITANVLMLRFEGASGQPIKSGTIKPMLYQDGDGTWLPYNVDSTPLSLMLRALPNGVCDTYENGVITRKVGFIEFDGSSDENWFSYNSNKVFAIVITSRKYSSSQNYVGDLLCDKLENISYLNAYNGVAQGIGGNTNNLIGIHLNDKSVTDILSFKAYLQSHPIKVWYELAEPTTEQVDLPVIPSYFPYTNAWHDSEVEASDLTWNILARQYGSGQTTIKKDEAVLTELDLNTERTATPTTVKVQLKDTSGNTFYVETSPECVYLKGTDGSEISQQNLNDKIGQLINLVAFYSANPTTVLADLKKYITTIS